MDKRPKRRKYKDNPYTLHKENGKFYVLFTDSNSIMQKIEVSEQVYSCFNTFELEDISEMNEYDRHIEHSDLSESTIERRSIKQVESVDTAFEKLWDSQLLYKAIEELPETQKRRLIKYYFEFKTFKQIGEEEGCDYQCVQRSVFRARTNLKRKLNR